MRRPLTCKYGCRTAGTAHDLGCRSSSSTSAAALRRQLPLDSCCVALLGSQNSARARKASWSWAAARKPRWRPARHPSWCPRSCRQGLGSLGVGSRSGIYLSCLVAAHGRGRQPRQHQLPSCNSRERQVHHRAGAGAGGGSCGGPPEHGGHHRHDQPLKPHPAPDQRGLCTDVLGQEGYRSQGNSGRHPRGQLAGVQPGHQDEGGRPR